MDQVASREWELKDFTSSTVVNGVEILLDKQGARALVVYPWYMEYDVLRAAMLRVQQMGFSTITEMGNLHPYRVNDGPEDDCDYLLVEAFDD
jgi:hypothetical protein